MSHYRLKTKYNVEAPYGQIEVRTLYAHHNLSCDVVSFFDDRGEFIMAVPDTIDNNLLDAINALYHPWDHAGCELNKDIHPMTQSEIKLCKL